MLFYPTQDKVLSFAAIAQAGKIVNQLATEPRHEKAALRASAKSLLETKPQSIDKVFGGPQGVELGLQVTEAVFKGKGMPSMNAKELIRYMMSMDQLADRLAQSPPTQEIIAKGLTELGISFASMLSSEAEQVEQAEYDDFYSHLGTLYQKTLSQLPPQIIVRGAQGHLQDERSVARVRTALFAGVRAAYLWHQQGGRRWQLLFARKGYASFAQKLTPG